MDITPEEQQFRDVQKNFRMDSDFLFRMQTLTGLGRTEYSPHLETAKRSYAKSERLYGEFIRNNPQRFKI